MVLVWVQLTDDMKANGTPSPPAKRIRLAEDHGKRKRVTFNPRVQQKESTPHPRNVSPNTVTLKEAADIVVRCLDPFYTQGKFATKVRQAWSAPVYLSLESCDISQCFLVNFHIVDDLLQYISCLLSLVVGVVQVVCSLLVSPPCRREDSGKRSR